MNSKRTRAQGRPGESSFRARVAGLVFGAWLVFGCFGGGGGGGGGGGCTASQHADSQFSDIDCYGEFSGTPTGRACAVGAGDEVCDSICLCDGQDAVFDPGACLLTPTEFGEAFVCTYESTCDQVCGAFAMRCTEAER